MPLLLAPASSPPELRDRLIGLRRRWRRAVIVRGVCAVVAAMVGAAVVVGLLDFAVTLLAVVRAALLVSLLTTCGLFVRRRVLQPWGELSDDLVLALRVEAHFPALNDSLASSVQFLDQPDDDLATGSPALRRATRRLAIREAADCDFGELLDARPLRRARVGLAAALLVAVPLVFTYPAPARTGLARFFDPFGDHPWPPQTALTLDAPDWLARGEPFVLRGRLAGVIPERVDFGFALDHGLVAEQTVAITPEDDGGSFIVRLEPNRVPKSFRYRVRANDSETHWRSVRVLMPPQLAPLDGRPSPLIHLDYPAYTDLTPRDLPDGGGSIECVTGTVVRIRAATDRPIARAWIESAADPPRPILAAGLLDLAAATPVEAVGATVAGQSVWGRVPAILDADGLRFEIAFRPLVGGQYYLRFEDESGIGGRRPMLVLLQPDPAPAVSLERPSASQDTLAVLPDATVPLASRIEDIVFAVRNVTLEYRCGKDEPVQRLPLYEPRAIGAALPRLLSDVPLKALPLRRPLVLAERRLDLKQFLHADGRPLREGDTLTLQVVADDFDDVTVGKPPGRSHEVELRIVGPAALQTTLHKAQADIERELKEMLNLQREALDRSTATETQRRLTGTLRPDDMDRLLQAEQLQQQLRNRLGNEREGVRAALDRLRRALRDNPLPRSPERDRLDTLAAELDRLTREELEPIEPLLTQARQERGPVAPEARKAGALPNAIEHQRESERTLRDLLEQLAPWNDARELRTESGALLRDQERASRERAELAARQGEFGLSRDLLTPEQREQLKRLEERQAGLADRSNDLLQKLNQKLREKQDAKGAKEAEAAAKENLADDRERHAADPAVKETPQAAELRRQAQSLRQQAEEVRESAAALGREAQALAQARQAAESPPASPPGQQPSADPTLAGQQRDAARQIGANRLGEAGAAQESAATMLRNMQEALQEQANPDADRLVKKLRAADRELEDLIQDQERLQKRAQEAGQIADPGRRKQELEQLAREQEQLQDRARELAQRLTRQHGEQAGRELRGAARAMDQARDQLDQGNPAEEKQDDALDRLDDAQRELTRARQDAEEELQREQRARMTDALKGLKGRQESLLTESERLFQEAKDKGWSRQRQTSLNHLAEAETALGNQEVAPFAEKQFQNDKVIAHIIRQAAAAMAEVRPAVDQIADGGWRLPSWENDRRTVQTQQQLALRRLTQILDVLKEDEQDRRRTQAGQRGQGEQPGQGSAGGEGVPPLAQLKLLRALQAEVNEQTEAFAKAHQDLTKLTPEEQAELGAIRRAQAELAALLDEAAPEPLAKPPVGDKK